MLDTSKIIEKLLTYVDSNGTTDNNMYHDMMEIQTAIGQLIPGQYLSSETSATLRNVAAHVSSFNSNYSHFVAQIEKINSASTGPGKI
jgi:hypothetical protein